MAVMTEREAPPRVRVPTQRDHSRCDLAGQFETLRGRRVVLVNEDGEYREWRIWDEMVIIDGQPFVPVVRERHWWAAELLQIPPRVLQWPAGACWLD